ncbi:hypothetical protein BV22DRAFT_1050150 [Leucogyrophana mollusca]|uniref:Uncharacterized protein n=1 Tax=Leucogyrophana mollusca TaxID=85980 RepID=A0ACB8B4K6_9AGAM|nr:hypothetical protein BV22DRAFT_1050150 [Leucogyrophana mollusca]
MPAGFVLGRVAVLVMLSTVVEVLLALPGEHVRKIDVTIVPEDYHSMAPNYVLLGLPSYQTRTNDRRFPSLSNNERTGGRRQLWAKKISETWHYLAVKPWQEPMQSSIELDSQGYSPRRHKTFPERTKGRPYNVNDICYKER